MKQSWFLCFGPCVGASGTPSRKEGGEGFKGPGTVSQRWEAVTHEFY